MCVCELFRIVCNFTYVGVPVVLCTFADVLTLIRRIAKVYRQTLKCCNVCLITICICPCAWQRVLLAVVFPLVFHFDVSVGSCPCVGGVVVTCSSHVLVRSVLSHYMST